MLNRKFTLSLKSKSYIARDTLELSYSSEDNLAFIPGQFYSFHFEVDGVLKARSYSAANPILNPRNNNSLTIAVTLIPDGMASNYFQNAKAGDQLQVSGPYGNLILPKKTPEQLLLIATGTGVSPYVSMKPELEKLLEAGDTLVTFAFGVRERQDLLYDDQFVALAEKYEHFDYQVCLSRQQGERYFERHGRVTSFVEQAKIDSENVLAYVCGNPAMVDEVVGQLSAAGLVTSQIKREKYMHSRF